MDTARLLLETLRLRPAARSHDTAARLAPVWEKAKTRGLMRLVAHEGCALWLLRRLHELGIVPEREFMHALKRSALDDAARNMLVDAEAEAVQRILASEGFPHVLLKGTARRAAAIQYPYADARATRDVDILLPDACARLAWDRLRERGYVPVLAPGQGLGTTHHLLPVWGPARVSVELHTSMLRGLPADEGWRRANVKAMEIPYAGRRAVVPCATELLWQGLAHGLSHDEHAWRLRFFLDVAVICASGVPIQWELVAGRLDAGEIENVRRARAWLGAAALIGGTHLPEEIAAGVAPFDLERLIRWRIAVLGRFGLRTRVAEKLLTEGTRTEIGLRLAPSAPRVSALTQARHTLAAAMARGAYHVWRQVGAVAGSLS
jgi:hypothetical protein